MDTMRFHKLCGEDEAVKRYGQAGFDTMLAKHRYVKPGSVNVYLGFAYDMPLPCHLEGKGTTGEPKAMPVEGMSREESLLAWGEMMDVMGVDTFNKECFNGCKLHISGKALPKSTTRKLTDADKAFWTLDDENCTPDERSGKSRDDLVKLYDTKH